MSDWITATALAKLVLPGIPKTTQGIKKRANKGGWQSRARKSGKGGGLEYNINSLPTVAKDDLFSRAINVTTTTKTPANKVLITDIIKPQNGLTNWQKDVMHARLSILNWVDQNANSHGLDRVIKTLVKASHANRLPLELSPLVAIANAKSGNQSGSPKTSLSRATIYRWIKIKREQNNNGLAPAIPCEKDFSVPVWATPLLELYRSPSKPNLTAVLADLPKHIELANGYPSYDQAKRFLDKISEVDKNKGRMGPQSLKALKAYTTRTTDNLWPGAVYTADGHTFKASVEHPIHGQPFRPEITTVLDVYTRYAVGWSIGLAENSIGVLEALSHAMIKKDDGRKSAVPAIWYTDNGRGFRNDMLEGPGVGFYDRWGITLKNALPYNSQARGLIERFQQVWVKSARQLITYKGRDMDKEAIRSIQRITNKAIVAGNKAPFELPWQSFKEFIQDTIDNYNNTPHSGLPKLRDSETLKTRHMTPFEAWTLWESEGGQNIQIDVADAADLFRPYERRKVSRCQVRVLSQVYFSHDLDPYHGQDVQVGYDIHNGDKVWVKDFEGRLLAIAEIDGNSKPYFDDSALGQATNLLEIKHQQRTKGRLNRLSKKIEEVNAEAGGILPMKQAEVTETPLTNDEILTADKEFLRLTEMSEPITPAVTHKGARPIFSDEMTWAKWLSMNSSLATEEDKARLRKALMQPGFKSLLALEDVAVTTLQEIAA